MTNSSDSSFVSIHLDNKTIQIPFHYIHSLTIQSPLLQQMTDFKFKERWHLQTLSFPQTIISERNLKILVKLWRINDTVNISSLIQAAHYLSLSEYYVHSILFQVTRGDLDNFRARYSTKNSIIPALYYCKYVINWHTIYDSLLTQLSLKSVKVGLNWSYTQFKVSIKKMIRSRTPSHDANRFGYCHTCCVRDCVFCQIVSKSPKGPWF